MSWALLAFEKVGDMLVSEVRLPETVDDAVIVSLVGDYPNLRGDSFPLDEAKIKALEEASGIDIQPKGFDYFIEFRGDDNGLT